MRFFILPLAFFIFSIGLTPLSAQTTSSNEVPEPPKYEFRSFWLATAAGMDWPPRTTNTTEQRHALRDIIHNAKDMGMNAIVFQIAPRGDAFYQSERLPWSSWLTGPPNVGVPGQDPGWDPLQYAIDEAHALGMELHAWYNVYMVNRETYDRSPDSDPPHVYYSNPEWIEQDGNGWNWINPAFPDAREWIVDNVVEIVENYDVDAVHFDFIRYASAYARDADLMQEYNPSGETNINNWRRENINIFARNVYAAVKDIKPWVKVGSTPLGHYRTSGGWAAGYAYSGYYQDSRRWLEEEVHDYVAPQLYWSIGTTHDAPRFEWLVNDWANDMRGRQYYLGTGPYKAFVKDELPQQIDLIRESPVAGHMHFSYRNINDNPFSDRYRSLSIVPPMPWLSMREPNPVKNLQSDGGVNEITLTWEEPDPGRGETNPFFRYVVYRAKASDVVTDQGVINNPKNIVDITGQLTLTDKPPAGPDGENYIYYVTSLSRNNVESDFQKVEMEVVSAEEDLIVPGETRLKQNYPNPFNPTTEIRFELPESDFVRLAVYDLLGREVRTLVNENLPSGNHTIHFDATTEPTGIYMYRLETSNYQATRKMMLIK